MIVFPQGDWDRDRRDRDRRDELSPQDRRALEELIEDERELARDYRQAAQRTRNGQLARLWNNYAEEARRRAETQQDILRRAGRPGGWGPGGWGPGGWSPGPGGWGNGGWILRPGGRGTGAWSPGPGGWGTSASPTGGT